MKVTRPSEGAVHGWLWVIAVSATLAIAGATLGQPLLVYLFKPLSTVLIFGLAATAAPAQAAPYRRWLLIGLLASLAGDVFLMLPGPFFIHGLVSFLLAHLCYLRAFASGAGLRSGLPPVSETVTTGVPKPSASPRRAWLKPALCYLAVCLPLLAVLVPRLPAGLVAPVLAYVACLAAMAACAWVRHIVLARPATRLAAIGGAFFVCSDALLAFNKFHTPFAGASLAVLATYWTAQTLLALSARR